MNQVNYPAMSDQELKQHFLRHREDKTALRAYLDRLSDRPREVITVVSVFRNAHGFSSIH